MSNKFRSGFVALIGRPNVGKSTLMNEAIGQKIAIMSDKPQTTRNQIRGIYTDDKAQVIFLDTPGIHKPKSKLGEYLVKTAQNAFSEVDLILFLVDAEEGLGGGDQYIIERLKGISTPVFLVVNKIDKVHPDELLPFIDQYRNLHDFSEIVPISALQGNNTERLLDLIKDRLPEGPMYYPEDQVTDHPEKFIMGEIIREKVLELTHEEIPHSVAVVVEETKLRDNQQTLYLRAAIVAERKSQKGILIGKQGAMLKQVGKLAREEMERLFGYRIFLDLWVKVRKDWRNEFQYLREYGYRNEE
ncbi:GTPase Era [Shimazuella alba]|jgi:GTP-binding protein Era|uniref:GTPase Era n=1 Tax=Shimazuella alba TaxID=2690964 RepID=A0A6I4VTX6_9BACL|nr:GTPase Era [Shimazuella alba]MXQ53625.1 GTPase Era [Shimazuella alba]